MNRAMNRPTDPFLQRLITVLLCLLCSVALAVPKAAEQEEDEVSFGEAGAPPKRTTKPYRAPVTGVATPSASARPARTAHPSARATARPSRFHPPARSHAKTPRIHKGKPQARPLAASGKRGFSRHVGNTGGTMVKRARHTPRPQAVQRLEHRRVKAGVRSTAAGRHASASGRPAMAHKKPVDKRKALSRKNRS